VAGERKQLEKTGEKGENGKYGSTIGWVTREKRECEKSGGTRKSLHESFAGTGVLLTPE
jgi:hypothetical protein